MLLVVNPPLTKPPGGVDADLVSPKATLTGTQQPAAAVTATLIEPIATIMQTPNATGTISAKALGPKAIVAGSHQLTTPLAATARSPKFSAASNSLSFVTRDPVTGYLMLDGARFRVAGNNGEMAGLSESSTTYGEAIDGNGNHIMNHAAIDDFFVAAVGMNARVVRIQLSGLGIAGTFMPTLNNYVHANLEGYDYAITKCQQYGIRIIANLVDDYQYASGGKYTWCTMNGVTPNANAHEFFTNATVIASFKAYVSAQLNHVNVYTGAKYKDDPAFLAWETGNEISDNTDPQALLDWTADLAQYIKVTVGTQSLIMDGKWSIISSGVVPTAHMNNPYIDIFTEHTYDQWRTPAHMANQATICHNYGKAFIVGEFPLTGLNQGGSSIGWGNTDMIAAAESNTNLDGTLFWSLQAQGNFHGGGFSTHYPGDDGTMIARVTAQKNHAIAMAGATLTNATTPKKASTIPALSLGIAWTSRGAVTVSSGQATLPSATSGGTALSSSAQYDLTNTEIFVELVTKNPGTGNSGCGMYVKPTQAPYSTPIFGIIIEGNTVKYRYDTGGGASETTEAYNSSTHRWLRLRTSADANYFSAYPYTTGTVYWDVSTDGKTWVNKRSATIGMQFTSVYGVVYNDNWGSDVGSGSAVFDHFNVPASVGGTIGATITKPVAALSAAVPIVGNIAANVSKITASLTGTWSVPIVDGGSPSSAGPDIVDGGSPSSAGPDIIDASTV